MTIFTRSKWYYGHAVGFSNRLLNFKEGADEISIELRPRGYTLTGFAAEIQRAMNIVGGQSYSVTVNRATRQITISAPSSFELIVPSGVDDLSDPLFLAGFTSTQTGTNSYTGIASGKSYSPMLALQGFTNFDEDVSAVDSVVNQSASGRVESVTFGRQRLMTCEIRYVTNNRLRFIEENTSAVAELKDFLGYAITKGEMEFMQDANDSNSFTPCILERTISSPEGTGFRLTESDGIPGFYDTGSLVFRERI